jgi:hypothetical protein
MMKLEKNMHIYFKRFLIIQGEALLTGSASLTTDDRDIQSSNFSTYFYVFNGGPFLSEENISRECAQ